MSSHGLFLASLSLAAPTFGWLLLGVALYRLGWLSAALNDLVARTSFRWGLPLLLFFGAARTDFSAVAGSVYLWSGIVSTFLVLAASWWYGRWRSMADDEFPVFVQAAYRSNLVIIGMALVISAHGQAGLALAALPVAVLTVLYNVIAVWLLDYSYGRSNHIGGILLDILRNPLIIGILAGLLYSLAGPPLPGWAVAGGRWFSVILVPLLLVCVGAGLSLQALREAGSTCREAAVWRLLLAPLMTVGVALMLGVRGEELSTLYLLTAAPVASASFVMVVAVGGNARLAANVIAMTTLVSPLSVTLGYFLLSLSGVF